MRVMALGTNAGRPTRTRNMSAVAVDFGPRWALVDAAEGTQHQALRFGLSLHRLSAVCITHLHGDHVLGLPGLLATMGLEGRTRPLTLVGPTGLGDWLRATRSASLLWVPFAIHLTELPPRDPDGTETDLREVARVAVPGTGNVRVHSAGLRHRVPAHGYRFTEADRPGRFDVEAARALGVTPGPDYAALQAGDEVRAKGGIRVRPDQVCGPVRPGRTVVVCTDTTPCAGARALCHRADLVIHEATFDDATEDEAERYRHCTAAQAAGVAASAQAGSLLITHFSSRFEDPAPLVDEARRLFPATEAAVEGAWVEVTAPHDGSAPTG